MQMSFFDFEEFNELKAEAKKKEAPTSAFTAASYCPR